MARSFTAFVLALVLVCVVAVAGVRVGRFTHGAPLPAPAPAPVDATSSTSSSDPAVEFYYTEQTVDHFNPANTALWSQRYYVNETFWTGEGPVFLCVGGETPLTPDVAITGSFHCAWALLLARYYGGLYVALEHRFYGKSQPMPDFSTASLAVLSSRQALADLEQFMGFFSSTRGLKPSNVVFSFGGSYPGMLAGWSRLKLDSLIYGAIASSAPVQAVVDYYGYYDVSYTSLEYTGDSVGGSPECVAMVVNAYAELGAAMLEPSLYPALESQFNVCPNAGLSDKANWVVFAETVSGVIDVQENDPACTTPGCSIGSACALLLNASSGATPLDRLATLYNVVSGSACQDIAFADEVAQLLNITGGGDGGMNRAWTYQTCAEFGFFQTCEPGRACPFVSDPLVISLDSYLLLCELAFGIKPPAVYAAVKATNAYYGGWNPVGSRVMWVNGAVDPWHALSVRTAPANQTALWVHGSSHHAWTHVPLSTDQPTVIAARVSIAGQIQSWLDEAAAQFGVTYSHLPESFIAAAASGGM